MKSIKVEIKGIKEFKAALKKSPRIAKEEIGNAVQKATLEIRGQVKREAPVDDGKLRQNIYSDVKGLRGTILPIRASQKYAICVHEGTKPHHPPVKEGKGIHKWATKKGLNPYAVAKSIAKKGTKANPFMDRAVNKTKSKVNQFFEKALENIVNRMAVK